MTVLTARAGQKPRAAFYISFFKKACLALLCGALALSGLPASAVTGSIDSIAQVESDAWLVMDAGTGQLLAAKNPDKQKYPASITKILTLALVLEHGSLDDTLTVSDAAARVGATSHIALQPGEVITVRDAVMATLLASANDAANCLAEYVSGSNEAFAALMNEKLAQLGCTGTHFANPSGLPADNHYTTARDMAKITAWALTVPGFRELFGETFYTMPATNKQPEKRSWGTQNAMIVTSAFTAEGAWGGKLGWTEEARHTMVTTLTREGRDLILVTMDSQHKYQKYRDGLCILENCFEKLQPLVLDTGLTGPAAVPMYSGEVLLGTVPYEPEGLCVWVPAGAQAQLRFDWQLPDRLAVGDTAPAALKISLPAAAGLQAQTELTLAVPQGDLTEVQTAWRALQAETDGTLAWQQSEDNASAARRWRTAGWIFGIPAGLVALAFCIRWTNRARYNLRRYGSLFRPKKSAARRAAKPAGSGIHMVIRDARPSCDDARRRQALRDTSRGRQEPPFNRR